MKNPFILLLCLVLGGCNTFTAERVPCPKTAILAEFSKTVEGEKDSAIRTEMDSLTPTCTEDGGYTFLDMRLRVTSFRPLAAYHQPLQLSPSYFVAVIDTNGTILSRTNHEIAITFEEKQTTKVAMERIQEKIPVNKDVTVYVGFNLDEAQVAYFSKVREKKGL
jgi:hypothetical protein